MRATGTARPDRSGGQAPLDALGDPQAAPFEPAGEVETLEQLSDADAATVLDLSRSLSGRTTDLETGMNTLFSAADHAAAKDFVVLK